MRLLNPTDDELNAAFAEKVAGWRAKGTECVLLYENGHCREIDKSGKWTGLGRPIESFTKSADAVLPWLEKHTWRGCSYSTIDGAHRSATVEIVGRNLELITIHSDTLPRAAVIALLRAHGIEVGFTK